MGAPTLYQVTACFAQRVTEGGVFLVPGQKGRHAGHKSVHVLLLNPASLKFLFLHHAAMNEQGPLRGEDGVHLRRREDAPLQVGGEPAPLSGRVKDRPRLGKPRSQLTECDGFLSL